MRERASGILAGIASAGHPAAPRPALWAKLAGPWKPKLPDELVSEVTLDHLEPKIQAILAGKNIGRVVVTVNG